MAHIQKLWYHVNSLGTWRSLVARLFWEQDVAGSNPVVPTIFLRMWFNGRTRAFQARDAGSIPVIRSNVNGHFPRKSSSHKIHDPKVARILFARFP